VDQELGAASPAPIRVIRRVRPHRRLHERPVDHLAEAVCVVVELGEGRCGITVREHVLVPGLDHSLSGADQVDQAGGVRAHVLYAAALDAKEHWRPRREVERHVVAHGASRPARDPLAHPPRLDGGVGDIDGTVGVAVATQLASSQDRAEVREVGEVVDRRHDRPSI
jgi:hypothetical protein